MEALGVELARAKSESDAFERARVDAHNRHVKADLEAQAANRWLEAVEDSIDSFNAALVGVSKSDDVGSDDA